MEQVLFSEGELKAFAEAEIKFVAKARRGNPNPLFDFWRGKRKAVLLRAFEQGYYVKD